MRFAGVFSAFLAVCICGIAMSGAQAQTGAQSPTYIDNEQTIQIVQTRGADTRVNYASLTRFGPWDDRNYQLTLEDLRLLSPEEHLLHDPIPAFYRVILRKNWPNLRRTGVAQYPRSAVPFFRTRFGGYLVDGKHYNKVYRRDDRFELDLSAGQTEAGAESLSGEVRITSPNGAAESAIKVSPVNSDLVIAGSNGPIDPQTMYYSSDGGETWTVTSLPRAAESCCDPAVDWSSDGGFAYTTSLGSTGPFAPGQVYFYRSDDNGQTWDSLADLPGGDPIRSFGSGSDKEYLHVDKHASSPFKDNIYVTWHDGNVMQFARSTDFGATFSTQSLPSDGANLGIGSDITTDANGHVYYIWPGFSGSTIRLAKSTDGGVTFGTPIVMANTEGSFDYAIPAMDTRRVFIYVSADADLSGGSFDGSIYAAWTDLVTGPEQSPPSANHSRITVAYSRDGGATWNTSTPHETADSNTVDRFHQWLAVGPDGTVHVVYYDTRRDAGRTSVDLFYSFSIDGAVTWSAPERVTSVQSPKINDGFEWGDYNGLDIVLDNMIAIFTDNRDEAGGSAASVDVYGAGITPGGGAFCGNGNTDAGEVCDGADLGGQTCTDFGCGGGTLACASDCNGVDTSGCLACGGPGRVPGGSGVPGTPLLVNRSGGDVVLSWDTSCGGGDDFAVYEGIVGSFNSQVPVQCSTAGLTSLTFTPGAGNRFFLVVPTASGNEGSYGLDSDGAERAVSASACAPQSVGTCP
ncbi:hypothetical protein ABI59_22970 [Acidobacteria bacterium Mor1]|nr:hypothetical protein ABI59_22970 [Acidobacteria bacterium Mor1]